MKAGIEFDVWMTTRENGRWFNTPPMMEYTSGVVVLCLRHWSPVLAYHVCNEEEITDGTSRTIHLE